MTSTTPLPNHILFVIDSLNGRGGAEGALVKITRGLIQSGVRCSIITFNTGPFSDLASYPCPVRVMNVRFRFGLGALAAIYKIFRQIRSDGVDVVHTFFPASDILGGLAGMLGGCRLMISSRRDMGILARPGHELAYRIMNKCFDQIQAVSERVREFVIEHDGVDPAKVVTVYNGVDLDAWQIREKASAPEQRGPGPRIVSIGHMRRVKGYDVLLRAAARVVSECPSAQFLIIGGESEKGVAGELRELAGTLGISNNVRFLGPTHDVPDLIRHGDIYCLLSRSEGLSNALIEAMAAGLPPVVTAVGGNPEVVEHGRNGLLVPSEDPAGAASAILDLIANPDRREEMGRQARTSIEQRFSTKRMIATMLHNYQALLHRPGRRSALERAA